ncbi:hypothetical protein Taro_050678 [Colocasia esculenta]|uniref:Uncharacterized protein n=1 Tax=Colocasia esculenta TaxID=4460 RepID=A0A843XEK9_COLES|nr:hypothetical protein [Colocasia esculenta]
MDNNGMSPSSEDMAWGPLQIYLQVHFNGKSLDDVIASIPVGVNSSNWQTMCEKWTNADNRETMTQLMAPSSESHNPTTLEEAFISVMGKDRPVCVRCAGSGETLNTWYRSIEVSGSSEREKIM